MGNCPLVCMRKEALWSMDNEVGNTRGSAIFTSQLSIILAYIKIKDTHPIRSAVFHLKTLCCGYNSSQISQCDTDHNSPSLQVNWRFKDCNQHDKPR